MDDGAWLIKALDYMEEHLKNDCSVAEVARAAGYSKCHFIGRFREAMHLTPADYLRKRRISEIVRCMEKEDRPIFAIAFEYGFRSMENFTRAFKQEHRILPTEYRTVKNSLKLYDRVYVLPETFSANGGNTDATAFRLVTGVKDLQSLPIHVSIQQLEDFRLVVYRNEEETPPAFWNKYNAKHWSKRLSGGKTVEDFGVSEWKPDEKRLQYYIGIRETEALGDRKGTLTLEIPGGSYAVFETPAVDHFAFVNMIHLTWEYIGSVWLPQSGYRRRGSYELESYTEESRSFSERIYLPVELGDVPRER